MKVGHGGTLDKLAQGVLVLGIGSGCQLLENLLHSSKRYSAVGHLGIETETLDAAGLDEEFMMKWKAREKKDKLGLADVASVKIPSTVDSQRDSTTVDGTGASASSTTAPCMFKPVQKPYDHITQTKLIQVMSKYTGSLMQTPPLFSALKINGVRASDMAMSGASVTMVPRPVFVHSIELTSFEPPLFSFGQSRGQPIYTHAYIYLLASALLFFQCACFTYLMCPDTHTHTHTPK